MAITKATGGVIQDGTITGAKLAVGAAASTDNVSLLGFKVASADSLAIFNMKDGIIDDYQDATGVDASASTNETRESSGKYYSGTGGTTVSGNWDTTGTDGGDTWWKWTTVTGSGTFSTSATVNYEYLIVAGAGGGGAAYTATSNNGGGGGAGGYRTNFGGTEISLTAGASYAVVVGDGGAGGGGTTVNPGAKGSDSSVIGTGVSLTSAGGGGGAGNGGPSWNQDVRDGGSGGGSTADFSSVFGAGNSPSTSPAQGFPGGEHVSGTTGAGGGGASAAGGDGDGSNGPGGAGTANAIGGSSVSYAGGGGGGGSAPTPTGAPGGAGGGGSGGDRSNSPHGAVSGTDGLGGGGGGAGSMSSAAPGPGGDGGSGIVILRAVTPTGVTYNNMTLVSNAQTAQAAPSNSRVCMLMDPAAGTTTINTDIKAYVSRDNGTTYSQATLADEGTYSGTQKILAGTVDVSGQPSGTSLRYKIETLNQSVSKQTRIYGTSLSWL